VRRRTVLLDSPTDQEDPVTSTLTPTAVPPQRVALDALRAVVSGVVAEPHEDAYAEHATPWNLAVAMAPTAVVAVRTAEDVVATVRFASDHGLTVGVQATGHAPVSALAGHLLISTRALDEVTVHAEERWARVGAGVKWGRVVEAAAPHGLAPLNGSTGDVGVVGYLTGGGVGPMVRTFGCASDTVRAFEVVTGDGALRRVTPTEHPDLFFALRGGKGVGGIVTAVEIDLLPVPQFYGGALYFDGADAPAVVDRWRTWSAALPEAGTSSFVLLQLPPLPFVPPPLAGRLTIGVRFLWTGDAEEGARHLAALREVAPVVLDDTGVKPYAAVDSVHADPVDPMPVVDRSIMLREFTAETAQVLLERTGPAATSPLVIVEVRQLDGALTRPGQHPSAFVHRHGDYNVLTIGMAFGPAVPEYTDALFAALAPWDSGRVMPNFVPAHDAASARRAYDEATLQRLAEVAETYDPAGVLAGAAYARAAVIDLA